MKLSDDNQQQKCTENLLFLVVQSDWTLRINQSTFSNPCLKMQGRVVTKKDFVNEFWMVFCAKKDQRKISTRDNQMYLLTSKQVRSL